MSQMLEQSAARPCTFGPALDFSLQGDKGLKEDSLRKTFVSVGTLIRSTGDTGSDGAETKSVRSATAAYRCKLYRAHLKQGVESRTAAAIQSRPKERVN